MLNVAIIMGRLVADPELRHTPNDIAVTSFTVAVDTTENVVGNIPATVNSGEWTDISGEIEAVRGVHALYFAFKGSGWLDFVTFSLLNAK